MSANKKIFSDKPDMPRSMDGFQTNEKSKQDDHKCVHDEDWGITKKTLEDHERRISKGEEVQTEFKEELAKRDNKIYEAFEEVKKSVQELRTDLKLTQKENGTQNDKIKGIQEEERQKILSKGQKKGIILGAIVGVIGGAISTFIVMVLFRVIEIFTFL